MYMTSLTEERIKSFSWAIEHCWVDVLCFYQGCMHRFSFGCARPPFRPLPHYEQKSIGEFLTDEKHAGDSFHQRLDNPLSAEFGVRKWQDLEYMMTTGLPNMTLVSWASSVLRLFRTCLCTALLPFPHVMFGFLPLCPTVLNMRLINRCTCLHYSLALT